MRAKIKPTVVSIPLTGLRFLYKSLPRKKIVCEIDMNSLKRVNEPETIDEMIALAHLEYHLGKTKGFKSTKKLLKYLNS